MIEIIDYIHNIRSSSHANTAIRMNVSQVMVSNLFSNLRQSLPTRNVYFHDGRHLKIVYPINSFYDELSINHMHIFIILLLTQTIEAFFVNLSGFLNIILTFLNILQCLI